MKVRIIYKYSQLTSDMKNNRKNEIMFTSPFWNTYEKFIKALNYQFSLPLRDQEIEDYKRINTEFENGI